MTNSVGGSDEKVRAWPDGALSGARRSPLWLDTPDRPAARASLTGPTEVDLIVVGAGFTGLWTALRAVERDPTKSVLMIEADRIAEHATGRNGGFCEANLTHGEQNGRSRWPEEYDRLRELGLRNLDEIEATVHRYQIECGFVRGGVLAVATRPHEIDGLSPEEPGFLDTDAVRRMVDSPTYLAGRHQPRETALVDPARLAWGLADAAERRGVRIVEQTRLTGLRRRGAWVEAATDHGLVRARQVVLATNAFPNPLRRLRWSTVPVFDYVLATEPLTDAQLAALRWDPAIGVADSGNQFHYYRITPDGRILWGGYDAIYHYGRSIRPEHYDRPETFATLARNFAATFPQLHGIRFSHRWSGVIDTSTRFAPSTGPLTEDTPPTPSDSPDSESEHPGSQRMCCSICLPARRRKGPSWRWSASGPSRSRRNHWRRSASTSPADRSPAPTGPVGATSGFACSTA